MKSVIKSNSKIVERIIRDKNGNFFRAYFLVIEREGKFFGKLVKIEPVKEKSALPAPSTERKIQFTIDNLHLTSSPYFSEIETFFTSQMTRAPSIGFRH